MAHTPGPWKWEHFGETAKGTYFVRIGGLEIRGDETLTISCHQHDQNLIASAPEMLEALKQAIRIMEAEPEACGIYKANMAKFKAIIAKIEGR